MRVCPKCNETYSDENLNFCLSDGELLLETETQDAPPTMILDSARVTNEGNWDTGYDPGFTQQDQQYQQNQQIYQQPIGTPMGSMQTAGKNQTLPLVSIISGISSVVLSLCCYSGIIIGPVALIIGFIGMNNANKNPDAYDGKNLAVIGMISGGVGLAVSVLMLVIMIISSLLN